jgi:hypothetical protein
MLVLCAILYSLAIQYGGKMIYGNMPMMIFLLAAGYLFSVYLLLALAKRIGKRAVCINGTDHAKDQYNQRRVLTTNVTEAVNSQ